jgi:hypothetical protein
MNSPNAGANRQPYRPSGKFHPARLVGALAMLAGTSAALSIAFLIVLLAALHFPLIILVLPVIALVACATYAVSYAQIRHPLLAAVLAGAFGAAGYLGTFHLDHCLRWHAPWTAVGQLPAFIAFRMETDGWFFQRKFWVIHPAPANANFQPQIGLAQIQPLSFHWAAFFAELAILTGAPAFAAWLAASAPFSEKRRRWMVSETLMLHPDTQAAFQQALAQLRVDQWVDADPPRVPQQTPHWRLTVCYTPSEAGQEADSDVFVQLGQTTYVRLLPAEAAALVTLLPGLLEMAGPARQQLAAEAELDIDSARIWPVPAPHAGQLQTVRHWWTVQSWATFWYLGVPAAILLLAIGGGALVGWLIQIGLLPLFSILVYVGIGIVALLAFYRYVLHPGQDATDSYRLRFELRLLREALAQRPGALIDATDEQSVYALAKPRRLWKEASGNRLGEANHGLLVVDDEQQVLLFEGNYELYLIPAEAIVDCTLETPPTQMVVVTDPWAVVVTARLGSGTWEFPFFPLANIPGTNNWERAAALIDRIGAMCGRTFGEPIAPNPAPHVPVVS